MNRSLIDAYYVLRPRLPIRLRQILRRGLAQTVRFARSSSWPILESAATVPMGWPGWPNGKQFAFVLTHDVEGEKGLARCCKTAELDKALGFRSSFNFVPQGEYRVPDILREVLSKDGFEIGVHDLHHDGSLYHSAKSFNRQALRINHHLQEWKAVGFRSGFMFHNLEWLHALDVTYDASTFDVDPFEPQPDGVGTVFPFWVQGNGTNRGYVELPYTLPQDSTLYLFLKERSIDVWKRKLDWVAEKGGMALVIVHPDYICFEGKPTSSEYPADLYEGLLKYVANRYGDSCWFALPREIASYAAQFKPILAHHSLDPTNKPGAGV